MCVPCVSRVESPVRRYQSGLIRALLSRGKTWFRWNFCSIITMQNRIPGKQLDFARRCRVDNDSFSAPQTIDVAWESAMHKFRYILTCPLFQNPSSWGCGYSVLLSSPTKNLDRPLSSINISDSTSPSRFCQYRRVNDLPRLCDTLII